MRYFRKCGQKMVCIEGICFTTLYDAGKFLMILAERGDRVTIEHRHDWNNCLAGEEPRSPR